MMIRHNIPSPGQETSDFKYLSIRKNQGLGEMICLFPVLDHLCSMGTDVNMITRADWMDALSVLRPDYSWNQEPTGHNVIDLDSISGMQRSSLHITDVFGRLMGFQQEFSPLSLSIPDHWIEPFEYLRGSVVFAPEVGSPARHWPTHQAKKLAYHLPDKWLVLVGRNREPEIICDVDLRGHLKLPELLGVLAVAGSVVTLDSAVLQLAVALQKPTVAIFGGEDPRHSVRSSQNVIILQANMECCPCHNHDFCHREYPCIQNTQPSDIVKALQVVNEREGMHIQPVLRHAI